jgi:hypothetical protein
VQPNGTVFEPEVQLDRPIEKRNIPSRFMRTQTPPPPIQNKRRNHPIFNDDWNEIIDNHRRNMNTNNLLMNYPEVNVIAPNNPQVNVVPRNPLRITGGICPESPTQAIGILPMFVGQGCSLDRLNTEISKGCKL